MLNIFLFMRFAFDVFFGNQYNGHRTKMIETDFARFLRNIRFCTNPLQGLKLLLSIRMMFELLIKYFRVEFSSEFDIFAILLLL